MDAGTVKKCGRDGEKAARKHPEVGFVANPGSKRPQIQSAPHLLDGGELG